MNNVSREEALEAVEIIKNIVTTGDIVEVVYFSLIKNTIFAVRIS